MKHKLTFLEKVFSRFGYVIFKIEHIESILDKYNKEVLYGKALTKSNAAMLQSVDILLDYKEEFSVELKNKLADIFVDATITLDELHSVHKRISK